jgi:hypothetical protein
MLVPGGLLNLDAELELASSGPYTRSRATEQSIRERHRLCASLTRGEPIVGVDGNDDALTVFSWCPTSSALAFARAAGLAAVQGPGMGVLCQVHHRRWPLAWCPAFGFRRYLTSTTEWRAVCSELGDGPWRCKRPYGFAGRGHRVLDKALSLDDQRWLDDSMRSGGLLLERNVDVRRQFSLHGYVDEEQHWLGNTCVFETDDHGAPTWFELAEADDLRDRELRSVACSVTTHLRQAGYFGPFGIDAFEYESSGGASLNVLSEVNPRFTLGWSLGMGEARSAALARYARRGRVSPAGGGR